MASSRYAHTRDEEYRRLVTKVATLCEVALRPTAIDSYAAEKLGQAADALAAAQALLAVLCEEAPDGQ
jgi:hypothetical protein